MTGEAGVEGVGDRAPPPHWLINESTESKGLAEVIDTLCQQVSSYLEVEACREKNESSGPAVAS